MSASERRALAVVLVLLGAAPCLAQQAPRDPSCDTEILTSPPQPVPPDHPAAILGRLEREIDDRGYQIVIDSLATAYGEFSSSDQVPPEAAGRFRVELGLMARQIGSVYASERREALIAASAGVNVRRFTPTRPPMSAAWRLFDGSDEGALPVPEAARPALCGRAVVLHGVLDLYAQAGLQRVAADLRRKVRLWQAYDRNTPTQYPWELTLNGFATSRPLLEPPRAQWVLLHPSVAGEISGRRLDSITGHEAAAIEWVGRVWSNGELTRSFGLALLSTVSSDQPVSVGLMGRFGRSLALGAVTRRVDRKWEYGATMSLDLYRIVAGSPDELGAIVTALTRGADLASVAAAAGEGRPGR
jgi:hypothetical protein